MSAQRRSSARGGSVATAPSNKVEKRTKPTKPAKGEAPKQNFIAVRTERLRGLVQDTMSEMRKINWPD